MPNLGDMVVRIVGDNSQFDASIDRSQKKFTKFADSVGKFGKNLTTFVTAPLLGIGIAAVRSTANMEDLSAAFETMLGSAGAAQKMLKDLTDFAATTPFQLADLANASKTLLAFGVDADKIMPSIQMLGDVAQGNAQRFGQMTLAFAQIQSTGRLMGQDLLQLINAGFNPLKIISEQTGQSMADLKKQMEQGAISAEMVAEAFKTATSAGGQFYGGMERASRTFNGLVSTLKDNIGLLGREFGELLLPKLKDTTEAAIELTQKFQGLDNQTKHLILNIGGLVASIGPAALAVSVVTKAVKGLGAAFTFLDANPVVAVIAALAGVALGLRAVGKARQDAEFDRIAEEFGEISSLAEVSAKDIQRVQIALGNAADAGEDAAGFARYLAENLGLSLDQVIDIALNSSDVTDEYKEQLELLKRQNAELAAADTWLSNERERAAANARAEEYARQAAEERARAGEREAEVIRKRIEAESEFAVQSDYIHESRRLGLINEQQETSELISANQSLIEKLREIGYTGWGDQFGDKAIREAIGRINDLGGAVVALGKTTTETDELITFSAWEVQEMRNRFHEIELENISDELKAWKALWNERLSNASQVLGQISAISSALTSKRTTELNNYYREEQLAIENSALSEEEKAARLSELDAEVDQKRRELERDQARRSKLISLFEIAINTASAIVQALPNVFLAALVGTLGAIQAGIVASTPLPALAQGGIVTPSTGGTAVTVAEAGQAEVIFPLDKLDQFLSDRSVSGGGSGGSDGDIHLSVMMDSKPFLDKIFPATRNRQILIDARAVV